MKTITFKLAQLLIGTPASQAPPLGGRELEVMKILWQAGNLSAKEVLERLSCSSLSLSSMQSTLERLYRKKLLLREKHGRFYVYRTAVSRSEMITQLLGDIAEHISDGEMAPMISGFVDFMDQKGGKSSPKEVNDAIERFPPDHGE
ncbi:BlaI/MecI/CopY family transcriptional regulator [Teredinibacter turnerae]|uniref:BlaI/MecI/CopY family transcriptional regulator n=1 Tax=Teredinibacter turnerae TaxID=2426 RepID=UPI00035C4916|nr:BlaI/MecI/CopY family transcriptional regulator [Teredinibacter turnerae]